MSRMLFSRTAGKIVPPARRKRVNPVSERENSLASGGFHPSTFAARAGRMPWGALPASELGQIKKSVDFTKPQVDRLIREYLPSENKEALRQRKKAIKDVFLQMRQNNMDQLRTRLAELTSGTVQPDEETYVSIIFGYLQLPEGRLQAQEATLRMLESESIHPSLKDLMSGFISSLKTLDQFGAFPNRVSLLKTYFTFSEIARDVRFMRILGFKVAMRERMNKGEIVLSGNIK